MGLFESLVFWGLGLSLLDGKPLSTCFLLSSWLRVLTQLLTLGPAQRFTRKSTQVSLADLRRFTRICVSPRGYKIRQQKQCDPGPKARVEEVGFRGRSGPLN